MYTDLPYQNELYDLCPADEFDIEQEIQENLLHFNALPSHTAQPDTEHIKRSITVCAMLEACAIAALRIELAQQTPPQILSRTEIATLHRLAALRLKTAKEEADLLATVDYERGRNTAVRYLPDGRALTSLLVSTTMPNPSQQQPFVQQDAAANESRSMIVGLRVQQIINFNALKALEAAGALDGTAENIYRAAVAAVTADDRMQSFAPDALPGLLAELLGTTADALTA